MCYYLALIPKCGHASGELIAFGNCEIVREQLMRIHNEPEAWKGTGLGQVPFEMPESCNPNTTNTFPLQTDEYCGWECWNNSEEAAATGRRMGSADAAYGPGSQRPGVGWRREQPADGRDTGSLRGRAEVTEDGGGNDDNEGGINERRFR